MEPEDTFPHSFEAPTKFLANSTAAGDSSLSTCSTDTESEAAPSDGHPGAQAGARPQSAGRKAVATGDALPSRPTEGTQDPCFPNATLNKRNRRGDWRQARKPFLSDLPEVDADIPYRVNVLVLGMAANQVVQSACGSGAAQSLVAKPQPEKEETQAAGGDFLSDVFAAAAKTTASEERDVDMHRAVAVDDDRCLCKVSAGPVAGPKLAKLAFTRVTPGADLPICASQCEALSTIMVITLVVAGSVLGEDPVAAIQDQLRALQELVELLRVRTTTKLRPVRALMLCGLDEDGSLSELYGTRARKWHDLISEFEEENGKLWKFGPVDASDKEKVHATFSQMASARVSSSFVARDGLAEVPEAPRLPGVLSPPYDSQASQTQQKIFQDLLPTLTRRSERSTSKTSTDLAVEPAPHEQVCFEESAEDAARLASFIDQASAALDKQSPVGGVPSDDTPVRVPTID